MTSIYGASSTSMADYYKQMISERFSSSDTDDDGVLTLDEFSASETEKGMSDSSKVEEMFSSFDTDGSGSLTENEMASGLQAGPQGGMGPPPGGPPPGGGGMPPPANGGATDSSTMLSLLESISETDDTETTDTGIMSLFETDESEEEDGITSLFSTSESDESDSDEESSVSNMISAQISQFRNAASAYQNSSNLLSILAEGSQGAA